MQSKVEPAFPTVCHSERSRGISECPAWLCPILRAAGAITPALLCRTPRRLVITVCLVLTSVGCTGTADKFCADIVT